MVDLLVVSCILSSDTQVDDLLVPCFHCLTMANSSLICLQYFTLFSFLNMAVLLCSFPLLSAVSDCLCEGENISSGNASSNIISPSQKFEAGFFTPEGSLNKSKYLGVWYYRSNPKIVTWVANREKPVQEFNHTFLVIQDGSAMVLANDSTPYWSTHTSKSEKWQQIQHLLSMSNPSYNDVTPSRPFNCTASMRLCLSDNGNLILYGRIKREMIVWQSFDTPITDTLLPGMRFDGGFNLTSWKSSNNPALGDYALELHPDRGCETLQIKKTNKQIFWSSRSTPFDFVPQKLFDLLKGTDLGNDSNIRLVMNSTGHIQLWQGENEGRQWLLTWEDPRDKCGQSDVCGVFASCNSNNVKFCKCLPGFRPVSKEKWKMGSYSDGCLPNYGFPSPGASKNSMDDIFLRFPMMRVGKPGYNGTSSKIGQCDKECLNDTTCLAYSCGANNCSSTGTCIKWWSNSHRPHNLQEEFPEGIAIFFRTAPSDFRLKSRSCISCGTYIIPYPLSVRPNCGDPSYAHFHCNETTGQVSFLTTEGTFNVTSIDPDEAIFFIQHRQATENWDSSRFISLLSSLKLPFSVKNYNVSKDHWFRGVEQHSYIEVEMTWKPPPEPTCRPNSKDCDDLPHTTCKPAKGGQMRCQCALNFKWVGSKLQCKVQFPLKVVLTSIVGALGFILLCGTFFIHCCIRERRFAKRRRSDEFKGDDTEGIGVPAYDWEIILVATDNFADANKLGTGGFGTVYKGVLPDGKEIAVKRLSTSSVQGDVEFKTEVVLIAKLQHRNLVRLLGYCIEVNEKILVYEFVPNGSLDSCLFGRSSSVVLDWEMRFHIIFGIARALVYLHHDSRLRIIHRDLKPSNILLDQELNPKIADFGIARIIAGNDIQASTQRVIGTFGYMSPKYTREGVFSLKSDVFSFGVIVLETISSKRNSKLIPFEFGMSTLLGQAWRLWNEDKALELMDETLKESCKTSEVLKCIHVALLCVQEEPSDRPTMSKVVFMLGCQKPNLPFPKPPNFNVEKHPHEDASPSILKDSHIRDIITFSSEGR